MSASPKIVIRLTLSEIGQEIDLSDPTFITDDLKDEAWNMINALIMDMLDERDEEIDDETFRELFIGLCYHLMAREMTTLFMLPAREHYWKDRLDTRKRSHKKPKGE